MRILVLNADYDNFLRRHYSANPQLRTASYADQMRERNDSLFASANFYSRNFRAHGHVAEDIHVNNSFLQQAWAREHGLRTILPLPALEPPGRFSATSLKRTLKPIKPLLKPILKRLRPYDGKWLLSGPFAEIVRAQIVAFQPDMILNQEMDVVRPSFFHGVLPKGCRLVGQIGSELPEDEDFRDYELVITCIPIFVEWFRARGINAHLNLLAFETSVLDTMGPLPPQDIPVSFVGSLIPEVHRERIEMLEHVARAVPLAVWGNGIERLPRSSPLHATHRGVAWGREMYDILRRSRVNLNQHGFVPMMRDTAANMRLYEATGMGSLLLTDAKSNLGSMFNVGGEVAAYTSPEDCVAKIRYYVANEKERAAVAVAGQRRTLADHTYSQRTHEIMSLVAQLPTRHV